MATISGIRTGFIGLGLMGAHMARNLAAAGAQLGVFNRNADKTRAFAARGAAVCASAREIGEFAAGGIVIVCVSDTGALSEVLLGNDDGQGLVDGLEAGCLVIDMGTSGVGATRELARAVEARGADYIDAPVSGGEAGAKAGTLTIMAGGGEGAVARAEQVFEVLGNQWTHIGPVGTGQVAKAVNQLIVGAALVAVAEGLTLAEAAGADPGAIRQALLGGFAASRILDLHGARMIAGDFKPGGRARTQLKDLEQAAELARQSGVELPGLERTRDLWRDMVARGWGDLDQAGMITLIRALCAQRRA